MNNKVIPVLPSFQAPSNLTSTSPPNRSKEYSSIMSSGFFSTRGRALKFPEGQHGTTHTLHITQPIVMEQQTENGRPLWWDAAGTRPREQAILSGYVTDGLSGPGDDGFRSIYVRGGIQKAVGAACRRAGVAEPGPGMVLTLEYTHDSPQSDPSKRPPKEYAATLETVTGWENDPRFSGQSGDQRQRSPRAQGVAR